MSGEGTCWKIEGDEALLACGPLRGKILLNRASRGLRDVKWNNLASVLSPLMLFCGDDHPGCRRLETYVRGCDLVSNYESDSPEAAPQIYWRVRPDAARLAVGVEVILSKHTPLLDSAPRSAVECFGGELWYAPALDAVKFAKVTSSQALVPLDRTRSSTHLFLFRDSQLHVSYAQMVHPSDFDSAVLTNQAEQLDRQDWHLKSFLFPERLEKGVIRRARIGGWFMPAENDLAVSVELARQFIDEPLPLTT